MFIWAAGWAGRRCLSTCLWQTVQAGEGLGVVGEQGGRGWLWPEEVGGEGAG